MLNLPWFCIGTFLPCTAPLFQIPISLYHCTNNTATLPMPIYGRLRPRMALQMCQSLNSHSWLSHFSMSQLPCVHGSERRSRRLEWPRGGRAKGKCIGDRSNQRWATSIWYSVPRVGERPSGEFRSFWTIRKWLAFRSRVGSEYRKHALARWRLTPSSDREHSQRQLPDSGTYLESR